MVALQRLKDYCFNELTHHLRSALSSLGQLRKTPTATLMTLLVIGIVFALPAGFFVVLKNVNHLIKGLDNGTQISLFLDQAVSEEQAHLLRNSVAVQDGVAKAQVITRNQALQEFQLAAGFADIMRALPSNPLPHLIVVRLRNGMSASDIEKTLQQLSSLGEVEYAQLDLQWVKRLFAIMNLSKRAVMYLAFILAFAAFVIVGNTIRMAIYHRRDEIKIIKLVGATDGFVRRPFLYSGLWYGLGGGMIACLIVTLSVLWLAKPIAELSNLYHHLIAWRGLGVKYSVLLIALSGGIGTVGAWLSVHRHLRQVDY